MKILFCPAHPGGSRLRKTSKKLRNAQNFKMSKNVPKSVQTCFQHVCRWFFRKIFCPVHPGGSRLRKTSKKMKSFQNFPKCPKTFPKVSIHVLNMFAGEFFKTFFAQFTLEGRDLENSLKKSKKFQNFKKVQKRSQRVQTCFDHV